MDNTEEFRCISLCSGYAGIELGLRRVIPSLRTVLYVEVEAFACTNLVAKIEEGKLDAAPIWTDIKTFNGQPFRDRIHIITGGYPCQPFSVAGQRKGTDDPRHLWPYIEGIIEAVRPIWCFFENVSGHLTLGFPEVYRSLRNLGYSVEAGLFTAAECGAPHKRERLFILAKSLQRWGGGSEDLGEHTGRPTAKDKAKRPSELADTTAQRIQRAKPERTAQTGRQIDEQGIKWPARPGQPQYEWEEPRVVSDSTMEDARSRGFSKSRICTKQQGRTKAISTSEEPRTICYTTNRDNGSLHKRGLRGHPIGISNGQKGISKETEVESRLGRAVNGTKSRVDRLRLLGNGVVPQCAERAFRTLIKKF